MILVVPPHFEQIIGSTSKAFRIIAAQPL